jgi:hypothetical protein
MRRAARRPGRHLVGVLLLGQAGERGDGVQQRGRGAGRRGVGVCRTPAPPRGRRKRLHRRTQASRTQQAPCGGSCPGHLPNWPPVSGVASSGQSICAWQSARLAAVLAAMHGARRTRRAAKLSRTRCRAASAASLEALSSPLAISSSRMVRTKATLGDSSICAGKRQVRLRACVVCRSRRRTNATLDDTSIRAQSEHAVHNHKRRLCVEGSCSCWSALRVSKSATHLQG